MQTRVYMLFVFSNSIKLVYNTTIYKFIIVTYTQFIMRVFGKPDVHLETCMKRELSYISFDKDSATVKGLN